MKICSENKCTLCGACEQICPKACISKITEKDGYSYMAADSDKCIDCGLCKSVCHVEHSTTLNPPLEAFAAFAKDRAVHEAAASGGIASTLYSVAIDKGYAVVGTVWEDDFKVKLALTEDKEQIKAFRNSKYTFSDPSEVFKSAVKALKENKKVFFVGLPCQVAAMKNYAEINKCGEGLFTADLVCHGTPPKNYLSEHIKAVSGNKKADTCYFRDPKYSTEYYAFTLYTHNKLIYKKEVTQDDLYQWGYHNSAIYRRNCYTCLYARAERAGDITLGDYHGLGKLEPYSGARKQVSCVIVNTEKGKEFWESAMGSGALTAYKRPTDEPVGNDMQFKQPSTAPAERDVFLAEYEKCGDFESAARVAFSKKAKSNLKKYRVFIIKRGVKKLMPKSLIKKLRGR